MRVFVPRILVLSGVGCAAGAVVSFGVVDRLFTFVADLLRMAAV